MKKILLCVGILATMIGAGNLAYADAVEKGTRMDYTSNGYHGFNLKMAVSSRGTNAYDAYLTGSWCAK